MVQGMAAELFQLASLLVGDGPSAAPLIESSLSNMEIDPCLDPEAAREQARTHVVRAALGLLAAQSPAEFAARTEGDIGSSCIEDDDLLAAGVSPAQLRGWLEGQGNGELRRELRQWLESLSPLQRVVFVQRAVLGLGNETVARKLDDASGKSNTPQWTAQGVSGVFRQALCSLANSLAHAPATGLDVVPA